MGARNRMGPGKSPPRSSYATTDHHSWKQALGQVPRVCCSNSNMGSDVKDIIIRCLVIVVDSF